jgi:DNA-directed RNA polymerase I subunit RPA2
MGSATVTSPLKSVPVPKERSSASSNKTLLRETCPSFRRGHVPAYADVQRLRTLSFPHVGSFDYFLEKGLSLGISDIVPFEVDLVDPKLSSSIGGERQGNNNSNSNSSNNSSNSATNPNRQVQTLKMWIENVHIGRPTKSETIASSSSSSKLTPRECRELGLMYSGPMSGDFCYQINHRTLDFQTNEMTEIPGKIVRLHKKFGDMPIMVMSKACHLNDKRPEQLVAMKEEVRERHV